MGIENITLFWCNYIHAESLEDNFKIVEDIRENGKLVGIALKMASKIDDHIDLLKKADYILLLTIKKPGSSGQSFDSLAFDKIEQINKLSFRNKFILCVDGGINESIVGHINSECIVSGSSVLKSINPYKQIMRLQTGNRYENWTVL